MEASKSWDELLQRSRQQLTDVGGAQSDFPPIKRNLEQLEALSRHLKAHRAPREVAADAGAATRLLAREGISAEQLASSLRSFALQTTFEDVFPLEAATVEEYLQQVHEMSVLAAMQGAQRSAMASFQAHVQQTLQEEWRQSRRDFVHSLARLPPERSASAALPGGPPPRPLLSGPLLPAPAPATPLGPQAKAAAYARAVAQMNAARERGQPSKGVAALREAFEAGTATEGGGPSVSLHQIWRLVEAMLQGAEAEGEGAVTLEGLLRGARRSLEAGHAQHMQQVIHSHAAAAALGGSPGNLQRVRAFLRVRLRDQGLLDFDAGTAPRQPPLDTSWQQVYCCLRSGFCEEALQVARGARVCRSFAPLLEEWVHRDGRVTAGTAAVATQECEKMARAAERGGRVAYDKKRMLVHAIVAGGRQPAERLLRDTPALFSSIQDFLWFRLALLRPPAASAEGPPPATLEELQAYLARFGPAYYTKGGRDPLLYPYVLLLAGQLQGALAHLLREAPTGAQRLDALHLGLALAVAGALHASERARAGAEAEAGREVAAMAQQWGSTLLRGGDAAAALEYFAAAAAAVAGGRPGPTYRCHLEALLRELLQSAAGAALLLGPPGPLPVQGALQRFVAAEEEQRQLVLAAAGECRSAGLRDQAVELLKRAGSFAAALAILVQRLAEAVGALAGNRQGAEARAAALQAAARDTLAAAPRTPSLRAEEKEALAEQQRALGELEAMRRFFQAARAGQLREALQELQPLPFLPFEGRTPEQCAEVLRGLSRPVEDCVPPLLEAMVACLERVPDTDGSLRRLRHKMVNLVAGAMHRNWPQQVYERVACMD